jgi:predicted enzyme related to lactoylglutathione lyase
MGQPVVHFEIMGKDGDRLRQYYSSLFGWSFDTNNPMDYGVVPPEVAGIGGGVGSSPEGYGGHVTFYIGVPDVEQALQQAESLGGRRLMGPHEVMENVVIGQFADPEGHLVGVVHGDG